MSWIEMGEGQGSRPSIGQSTPAMGRLDASWRGPYIERATQSERSDLENGIDTTSQEICVFCSVFIGTDDDSGLVVKRGTLAHAILNAYPYASGHLLVLPKRHLATLAELNTNEAAEMWDLVAKAASAVEASYQPDGMNIGINIGRAAGAGLPGHLHVHVVPRWLGDTNFMTAVGETRVVPESLQVSLKRLRDAFEGR